MAVLEASGQKKSTVGHYRVSNDLYVSLEDEAARRGITLNALVGQILSTHARDDAVLEPFGEVKMQRSICRELLGLVPNDVLVEFAKRLSGPDAVTSMLANSGAVTLDAMLDYYRYGASCGFYSMRESKKNGKQVITLVHELGPKGSFLMKALAMSLFTRFGANPKVTGTDSLVIIEY